MNVIKACELIKKYTNCPECLDKYLGIDQGKLIIDDYMFHRSCKCGFGVTLYVDDEIEISDTQYHYMKHAIGYEHSTVKRGKYAYYRNYFTTNWPNEAWDNLVLKELATSRLDDRNAPNCGMIYFVSRKGMDLLEKINSVKISEKK